MTAVMVNRMSVEEAFRRFGWKQPAADPSRFILIGARGPLRLRRTQVNRDWVRFSLDARHLKPEGQSALRANVALPGPWKLATTGGVTRLRADFPRALQECGSAAGDWKVPAMRETACPVTDWVDDVSAYVIDGTNTVRQDEGEVPSAADITAYLEKCGWAAAVDGDVTRVTITLPRLFRHVTVDHAAPVGPRFRVELADLSDWPESCRRAAFLMAGSANDRLPLVRFAVTGEGPSERLVAEVRPGRTPRLPGVWCDLALTALRSAVALCARELAALREPELAQLVLAGQPAQNGKGEV